MILAIEEFQHLPKKKIVIKNIVIKYWMVLDLDFTCLGSRRLCWGRGQCKGQQNDLNIQTRVLSAPQITPTWLFVKGKHQKSFFVKNELEWS